MWIPRQLTKEISGALGLRPIILLTGARQTGKSSLLQHMLPEAEYVTLDHLMTAMEAEENPTHFLNRFNDQVILDEIQYAPSLFRELKILIDKDRNNTGKWTLTGSQRFQLMENVSESLAGRIAILELHSLSASELRSAKFKQEQIDDILIKGGYPELWANPDLQADIYFSDYVQTYLEKDLKQIVNVLNRLREKYDVPVIVSTHPRTRKQLENLGNSKIAEGIQFLKPFGFFDYVQLQMKALCAISDSGTISEESAILSFPAISLRQSMERPEAQDAGTIILTGFDEEVILASVTTVIDEHEQGKYESIPQEYSIHNTSWRVLKLILGNARLSNKWWGINS